jgi:hypothetical protein
MFQNVRAAIFEEFQRMVGGIVAGDVIALAAGGNERIKEFPDASHLLEYVFITEKRMRWQRGFHINLYMFFGALSMVLDTNPDYGRGAPAGTHIPVGDMRGCKQKSRFVFFLIYLSCRQLTQKIHFYIIFP